jgi:DNA invertase Pin-like site-specific DNA recombinase
LSDQKAKAEGKYLGRPENKRRNTRIASMLAAGTSYSDIQEATGCSRATVAKIAKRRAPSFARNCDPRTKSPVEESNHRTLR